MNKRKTRNISGLLKHASTAKNATEEKANRAIDALMISKTKKVNFKTVSELSGVSTTTLYNNPVLRERISSLRVAEKATAPTILVRDSLQCNQEDKLRQEIIKLKEDKHMLIIQLIEMEKLKSENLSMRKLLNQKQLE